MDFFRIFPRLTYNTELTQDITKRINFINSLKKSAYIYYTYIIKDGERADTIAYKYHGDQGLDWLIYLINDIYDPIFDWPMPSNIFQKHLINKFGSLETAYQTIVRYEAIINEKEELPGNVFTDGKFLIVDQDTYNSYPAERRRVIYAYDDEFQKNEDKRRIKLIDNGFVPQIMTEYANLFKSNQRFNTV